MAVLAWEPNVKVEVLDSNCQPLPEYDDDNETSQAGDGSITKYIEAKSGTKFRIRALFGDGFETIDSVRMKITIDGRVSTSLVIERDSLHARNGHGCSGVSNYKDGQRYRLGFRFSELRVGETAEGELPSDLRGSLKSVGTISVSLWEITELKTDPRVRRRNSSSSHEKIKQVSEKSLKGEARSHQVTFSRHRDSRHRKPPNTFRYVNENKLPFAEFHFKYRSMAALRSLYVVPREPTPPPQRPEDNMTRAELQDLVRQLRGRDSSAVAIKQEPDRNDNKSTAARGRRDGLPIETIDLTGDD